MARDPAVRARHMKALLASVDRLPAPRPGTVRAALGAAAVREVEESVGVEWLPLGPNLALSRVLDQVLVASEFDRFHRQYFGEALRGPLFRAVLDGAMGVYGPDLGAWMRFLPTGWSVAFRDCGEWSAEPRARGDVELFLRELPAECVAERAWPSSVAACLGALVDLAGAEGAVELTGVDSRLREARFRLRWSAPRP